MQHSSEPAHQVTVVIPNWNGMRWIDRCLEALQRQTFTYFSIVLVDNGSTDGSVARALEVFNGLRAIERGTNTGFAHAVNVGIAAATSPYVVLLNNDTEVHPDFLAHLVACIEAAPQDVGAVSPQMLQLDAPTLIDDAGDELSWYGAATKRGHGQSAANFSEQREIFSPSAGASLYRRSFLEQAGGFDEGFFAYLEDVDLGLRGRLLGYRYLYEPRAQVLHKGHGSGIPRPSYVRLMTRNRLMLFCKNVPLSTLLRRAPKLVYGQLYFLIAYARPWSSLRGYASFLAALAALRRKRSATLAGLSSDRIASALAMIGDAPPTPPLGSLIAGRIRKLLGRGTGH